MEEQDFTRGNVTFFNKSDFLGILFSILSIHFFLVALHFAQHFPLDQSSETLMGSLVSSFWEVGVWGHIVIVWLLTLFFLEHFLKPATFTFLSWQKYFLSLSILGIASFEFVRFVYIKLQLVPCSDWCGIELISGPLFLVQSFLFISALRYAFVKAAQRSELLARLPTVFRSLALNKYTTVGFFILGIIAFCLVAFDYNTQGRYLGMSVRQNVGGNDYAIRREVVRHDYARYCGIASPNDQDRCRQIYINNCSTIQFQEITKCKEAFFREIIPMLDIENKIELLPPATISYKSCDDMRDIYSSYAHCTDGDRWISPNGLLVLVHKSDDFDTTPQLSHSNMNGLQESAANKTLFKLLSKNKDFTYEYKLRGQAISISVFVPIENLLDRSSETYSQLRELVVIQKQIFSTPRTSDEEF